MEEEKRRPQHLGGEGQHGAHVCHRCGWAYPNPHPSAKQRRSHKKHCGKAAGGGGDAGEKKASDEELSDEGRRGKLEEPIVEASKPEKEWEGGSAGSGGNVGGFCNGNTAEPSTLLHDTHVQGPDIEGVDEKLENGTHLGNHAGATMEREKSPVHSVLTREAFLDACEVKSECDRFQKVVDNSIIVSHADVRNFIEDSTIVGMAAATGLPCNPASESPVTNSKLQKSDDSAEIDSLSDHTIAMGNRVEVFLAEVAAPLKEPESISYSVEFNGEHLDSSGISVQLDFESNMTGNLKVIGNEDENLHALPMPLNSDLDKPTDIKNETVEGNKSKELNVSLISSGAEAEEPEYHPEDEMPELNKTELVTVQADRNAGEISSLMEIQGNDPLQVETEDRGSISKITDKGSTEDGDNYRGSPLFVNLECESEITISEFEASDGLGPGGIEAHPYSVIRRSSEAECTRRDSNLLFSHDLVSGDHMQTSDGGNIALFDSSICNLDTEVVDGSQLVIPVEAQIDDDVVDYRQEICKVNSSQSDTEISHNLRSDVSESKAPADENIGRDSSSLENFSQRNSDQGYQKAVQESSSESAVDSDTDHIVTKKEVQIVCKETDGGSLGKEPYEELGHREDPTEHLLSIPEAHIDKVDHQKDLQDKSIGFDVGNKNYHSITGSDVQIEHFETEGSFAKVLHEEINLNESIKQHLRPSPDTQSCAEESVLHNSGTSDILKGVDSGICDQSLLDKGIHVVSVKLSDSNTGAANTSVDYNGLTDNPAECQDSISDGTVPSTRHAGDGLPFLDKGPPVPSDTQYPKYQSGEKSVDYIEEDLFEAPSFMTLVEPSRDAVSNEIQSLQNQRHEVSESRRDEEIIEKSRVPLRNLLMEANLESKQKAGNGAQDHTSLLNKKGELNHSSRTTSEMSTKSSSFNQGDQKGWNSPARLPSNKNEKRKVKGRQGWVPFICCPSID